MVSNPMHRQKGKTISLAEVTTLPVVTTEAATANKTRDKQRRSCDWFSITSICITNPQQIEVMEFAL